MVHPESTDYLKKDHDHLCVAFALVNLYVHRKRLACAAFTRRIDAEQLAAREGLSRIEGPSIDLSSQMQEGG